MMPGRIVHGREAETRRLYNWQGDGPRRAHKRHFTAAQALPIITGAIGLLVGTLLGALS